MKESEFQRKARLYLGQQPDLVIWRNHAGKALNVSFAELKGLLTMLQVNNIASARAVVDGWLKRGVSSFGLAPGSADLVGIHSPSGRFVSIELKTDEGRASEEQQLWAELIRRMGGYSTIAREQSELELTVATLRRL